MATESGKCLANSSLLSKADSLSSNVIFVASLVVLAAYLLIEKYEVFYHTKLWIEYLTTSVPTLEVPMTPEEAEDDGVKGDPVTEMPLLNADDESKLNCYDPSTKQFIGHAKNMTAAEVNEILEKARVAQAEWINTTYAQRRMVLRTIQKYVVHHVEDICRVSARESGKPKVDAVMGEILTTCEKIRTICEWGELWLRPDSRPTGPMMMHKSAWVEYVPLGVIVAIAPWNYPFHNSVRKTKQSVPRLAWLGLVWFGFVRFNRKRNWLRRRIDDAIVCTKITDHLLVLFVSLVSLEMRCDSIRFRVVDQSRHFGYHGRKRSRWQGFGTRLLECHLLWSHIASGLGCERAQPRSGRDRHGPRGIGGCPVYFAARGQNHFYRFHANWTTRHGIGGEQFDSSGSGVGWKRRHGLPPRCQIAEHHSFCHEGMLSKFGTKLRRCGTCPGIRVDF